ncbi:MAG TPA: helix-turn-helix domain-containing protein [Streptosporangiaceae bacterium]|jgi:AcrR family transcriptional regulator
MEGLVSAVAERGYQDVGIGEIVRRAGVSRRTFYEHFSSKEECFLASYEVAARELRRRMEDAVDPTADWHSLVGSVLHAYLSALTEDPVAGRAFLVEIEAVGRRARKRRRESLHGFADFLKRTHCRVRGVDPERSTVPHRVYLGLAHAVSELAREQLDTAPDEPLTKIKDDVLLLFTTATQAAVTRTATPVAS